MKLQNIIQGIEIIEINGSVTTDITSVHIDSRKVTEGGLFIATRGTQSDGHTFIQGAIKAGATAILCEEMPKEMNEKQVTFIRVSNTEKIAGKVEKTLAFLRKIVYNNRW